MNTMRPVLLGFLLILIAFNEVYSLSLGSLIPSNPFQKDSNQTTTTTTTSEPDREGRYSLGNIISSAADVTAGVAKDIGNLLPTPAELFDSGKQLIAGYPFAFVSTAINQFCSAALASKTIQPKYTPDIAKMQFQLRTKCDQYNFPLLQADKILASPAFDKTKKVVILASGWTTNVNDTEMLNAIGKAYLCRGDTNFIAVDAAAFVDTLYTWSAFNTEEIGRSIAKGLKLIAEKVPVENIHLIGHSLGAHIVGAAGRSFTYMTGKMLSRITGLDPAKPCFNEGEDLQGIQRGDADFIDIIHSNPGVLGKLEPSGDADFYPDGLSPLPPGCLDIGCAHQRAWQYYEETVYPGNEYDFMCRRCSSLTKLRDGKCPGKDYPMGYAVPHNLKGNYFLEVQSEPPYGLRGDPKRLATQKECGRCEA